MALSTLAAKVQAYVGTTTDVTSYLPDFLAHSANKLISALPDELLLNDTTKTAIVTTTGLAVANKRILFVTQNTNQFRARFVTPDEYARLSASTSMFQATALDPIYTIYNGTIFVYPSATTNDGHAHVIVFFDSDDIAPSTDTSMTGVPDEFENLVILETAAKVLLYRANDAIKTNLAAVTQSTVVTVSQVAVPSFTAGSVSAVTVSSPGTAPAFIVALPSVPTYSFSANAPSADSDPSFTVPAITGTSISALSTTPSYSASLPTVPSLIVTSTPPTALATPSFTAVSAADYNYSSIIGLSALSLQKTSDFYEILSNSTTGYINGIEDFELAKVKIDEINTRIQEWNATAQEVLTRLSKDKEMNLGYQVAEAQRALEKEVGEYDATVKRYSQELAKYQADIQDGIARYNAKVQAYSAEASTILADAKASWEDEYQTYRVSLEKNIAQAQITSQELIKQNETKLAKEVQEYTLLMQKHKEDMDLYNAEIQKSITKFNADIQLYGAQAQNILVEGKSKWEADFSGYKALLDRYLADAQIAAAKAQKDADLALQEQIAEYSASVQKYQSDLSNYSAQVQQSLQRYQMDIARYELTQKTLIAQADAYMKQYDRDYVMLVGQYMPQQENK
jgi:hypothetical protein